jgi:hypothetical protein
MFFYGCYIVYVLFKFKLELKLANIELFIRHYN